MRHSRATVAKVRSVALLLALLLLATTAVAKPRKGRKNYGSKKLGTLNPSGVTVVDSDMASVADADLLAAMFKQEAAKQISLSTAHKVATGVGIVVAVLDGGFDLGHPVLSGSLSSYAYDAIDLDNDPDDLGNGKDDDRDGIVGWAVGHGNFVSGMVLMAAPDALIMPVRVMDDEGYGTAKELKRGLKYAIDHGADVINLSLEAATRRSSGVKKLLKKAYDNGILVVVSAGNDGAIADGILSQLATTITVGAVDGDDQIAEFSNAPDELDSLFVFAPGVSLKGPASDSMGIWSGTSFAAGIVSGAAALYLETHPDAKITAANLDIVCAVDTAYDDNNDAYSIIGRINLDKVVAK